MDKPSCNSIEDVDLEEISITQEEYNNILTIQQEILGMMAVNLDTKTILAKLCSLAEELLPNSVASVMIQNDSTGLLNILSAPSIPEDGHKALTNLKPDSHSGSCGNAVFKNEPQYVKNTFIDERWKDIRNIAYDFNICSCWSMPIKDENGQAIGSFALSSFEHREPAMFHKKLLESAAYIVDIVLTHQKYKKKVELLSNALANAHDGILITDKNNKIIEVNEAFLNTYGYSEKFLIGKDPSVLSSGKQSKSFYTYMWDSITKENNWCGEIINKKENGDEVIQLASISRLRDEENDSQNYLAIFTDLTELRSSEKKLHHMVYHDSLTNLYNKTHLEQIILPNKIYTLILLNVNNFSYINTAYGYEIGDKLLVKVSELLSKFNADSKYRINSDEFALLYEKEIDIENEIIKIQNYFYDNEVLIHNTLLNVSFTYGAAYGNKDIHRDSALALKQAKENGKNHYHIFNGDKDTINYSSRESFIESNNLLHDAINNDNLVPFFQGIYNNKSEKITKFEVLARIVVDEEIIPPFKFLQPARLSGTLPEITKIMVDKSYNIMKENDYEFSINITEDDLSRNYLINYLQIKEKQYDIDPNRVTLEILEGISATGKSANVEQLKILKLRGYSIAVDDFGTEYSNFERVLDLDIDYLKIDAKYIKDIDINPKSYEITKAISFFAKNANIPCIAEFVHSEAVQNIVKELGIDYSQGYYFSKPNPKLITD